MRRKTKHEPKEDNNVESIKELVPPKPVQPKVTRKGPRTKGKLYSRLADGSLVEGKGQADEAGRPDGKCVDGEGTGAKVEETTDGHNKEDMPTDDPKTAPAHSKSKAKSSWQSNHRRPHKQQIAAVEN
jgi:hypothetical protein